MAQIFDEHFMQGPMDETGLLRLSGSVEHILYSNEENGYAVCDFGTDVGDEMITITGTLPFVAEGDLLTVYGRWVHNQKYGTQFKVEQFEKEMPANKGAILRYLAAGSIRGIGPKTAQRIVERFGEDAFDVIENHPEWLADIPGISRKRAMDISNDFKEKSGIRSAMIFFSDFFGSASIMKIYQKYKSAAVDLAKSNPYRFCAEIDGIGFERADKMAQQLGFSKESEARICSGILYLLSVNEERNGHICLPHEKVVESTAKLLEVDSGLVAPAVSKLLAEKQLIGVPDGEDRLIYKRVSYENERYIARKLCILDKVCPAMETSNIGSFLQKEEHESGIAYASLQRKAIFDALENGVTLVTGGPGTGKTTVVRALLHIFSDMELRISLCAPTGRAAKRLSESTSHEARTIHRLLEYGRDDQETPHFRRNEKNLLEEDVFVVDEASMVDSNLFADLLRAIKPGARLIIIGDADQLPSVGAGNVLFDLLASGRFATVRLTEIFRQAEKSLIVTNAHAINRGQMPRLDVKNNDFFFLARESDRAIAETVKDLVKVRLPKSYGELASVGTQVICPSRKGEDGTENLNLLLQSALNPPGREKQEYKFRDLTFRVGDRVMQNKNNYDLGWNRADSSTGTGIFNGDIGKIVRIREADKEMDILFEDRFVGYPFQNLDEIELAYAITVHKSQGCEYPIVILPLGSTPPMLLTRNLLYTAVTRAQMMVILVGRQEILETMVKNHRQTLRYTGLCRFLQEEK